MIMKIIMHTKKQRKLDRHGVLKTIDETYNKIMDEKEKLKNNNNLAESNESSDKNNNDDKDMNNEDNNSQKIFEKIDNNESSGEDNKEETKKLKTSSNEENNKNTKLVDVDDDDKNISEKSYDITNKRQGETDNATGNRCWPFGWCSSCNGCAIFNQKIEQTNEQTFTK